jgi:HTH-type transcriptional regulator / antitoxin HigA
MATQTLHSDLAIPPGEFLLEVIEDLSMTQAELARRMARPVQAINEIIQGNKEITADTALQLEKVVDVPAHLWLNLESEYRLILARASEHQVLEAQLELLPEFPYAELVKYGLVKKMREAVDKVRELLKFFGVATLQAVQTMTIQKAAFRQLGGEKTSSYALAAWLRWGEIHAAEIEVAPFDLDALKTLVQEIRAMTAQNPQESLPRLKERLAACGVVLKIAPHFSKTYAHGATFWMGDKAVVMMSIRGKWADVFWFSLLHELAHVILHGKRDVFIEDKNIRDERTQEREKQADEFAANILIPPYRYREFINARDFSSVAVRVFAVSIDVATGVVVGRLQHEKHLNYTQLTNLRAKYEWSKT